MGAGLHDSAFIHDHDGVGVFDRGQPVRDDQRGAAAHDLVESGLDVAFRFAVQGRSRFVENQDRGILQKRPRDGHTLPLAPREKHTVVAHRSVQSIGQPLHEYIRMGTPYRIVDCTRVRVGQGTVGDVGGKGIVEQRNLLRHQGDLAAQIVLGIGLHRRAVDAHLTPVDIVETGDQAGQGRLAATRLADQGNGLPRLDGQVDALQHIARTPLVSEMHVFELDTPHDPVDGVGAAVRLHLRIELAEYILRRSQATLQPRIDFGEPAHRPHQQSGEHQEAGEVADGETANDLRVREQRNEDGDRGNDEYLNHMRAGHLGHHHFQVLAAVGVACPGKTLPLVLLSSENSHHPVARDQFRRDMGDVPHGSLDAPRNAPEAAAGSQNHHGHDGDRRHEDERQLPVQVEHAAQEHQNLDAILDDRP